MQTLSLTEDEFRLLAYLRGYADHCDQHLDPTWVREQLEFSLQRMQDAARGLVRKGLAEFFEFVPPPWMRQTQPEIAPGPTPCDIKLTKIGWNYLRRD